MQYHKGANCKENCCRNKTYKSHADNSCSYRCFFAVHLFFDSLFGFGMLIAAYDLIRRCVERLFKPFLALILFSFLFALILFITSFTLSVSFFINNIPNRKSFLSLYHKLPIKICLNYCYFMYMTCFNRKNNPMILCTLTNHSPPKNSLTVIPIFRMG